jgi:hypothetical protein
VFPPARSIADSKKGFGVLSESQSGGVRGLIVSERSESGFGSVFRVGRAIAEIISAVRETLFLVTTLMCRHQGRSQKG